MDRCTTHMLVSKFHVFPKKLQNFAFFVVFEVRIPVNPIFENPIANIDCYLMG